MQRNIEQAHRFKYNGGPQYVISDNRFFKLHSFSFQSLSTRRSQIKLWSVDFDPLIVPVPQRHQAPFQALFPPFIWHNQSKIEVPILCENGNTVQSLDMNRPLKSELFNSQPSRLKDNGAKAITEGLASVTCQEVGTCYYVIG